MRGTEEPWSDWTDPLSKELGGGQWGGGKGINAYARVHYPSHWLPSKEQAFSLVRHGTVRLWSTVSFTHKKSVWLIFIFNVKIEICYISKLFWVSAYLKQIKFIISKPGYHGLVSLSKLASDTRSSNTLHLECSSLVCLAHGVPTSSSWTRLQVSPRRASQTSPWWGKYDVGLYLFVAHGDHWWRKRTWFRAIMTVPHFHHFQSKTKHTFYNARKIRYSVLNTENTVKRRRCSLKILFWCCLYKYFFLI